MNNYLVRFEIDIFDATSPEAAARGAADFMRNYGHRGVFDVKPHDGDAFERVDLSDADADPGALRGHEIEDLGAQARRLIVESE